MSCAEPKIISARVSGQVLRWLTERGGIQVWSSADFSDPGWSVITPVLDKEGNPGPRPHWKAASNPLVITDIDQIAVAEDKEVRRFHVALRMGSQGLKVKLTAGSTRRVDAAVTKAGRGAYHKFDFETQEAVIFAPATVVPLARWAGEGH